MRGFPALTVPHFLSQFEGTEVPFPYNCGGSDHIDRLAV
jgi:hypothetical protein